MSDDDLLRPSLSQTARRELPPGRKPWRLNSQFYVAFFGGPLAAGVIGYLNGRRIGLTERSLAAIAAVGAAGFALAIVLITTVEDELVRPRFLVAGTGVLAFLAARQLQHEADRRYGLGRAEDSAYDSLVQPGLAVAVAGGALSLLVLSGLA